MDFFEVVKQRHSIRHFATTPVEREKLQKILATANQAPSAGNLQSFEIYVASGLSTRLALAHCALGQSFIAQAPYSLVFCTRADLAESCYGRRGKELYAIQDATIACSFAMLAATALGLGSVWVGAFDERAVGEILGSKKSARPVAILPIGYTAESPVVTPRRSLTELVLEI